MLEPNDGRLAETIAASGANGAPATFVQDLFGRVPAEDLAPYGPGDLAGIAAASYAHLSAPRTANAADIRLIDVEVARRGRPRDVTVLDVVNDDKPFLLDSTLAALVEYGYEPLLVAHPILAVERDPSGALLRLAGEATAADGSGAARESLIHIHLNRIDDPDARARLVAELERVYADVAVAVRDWPAMRARIADLARLYRTDPPPLAPDETAEAAAF